MSRPLRLEFPGAIWHVTSRGNERRDIVRDDADRRRFVNLLARAVVARRWILHAWVLMSNHYHLLIETPEIGLSRGVKQLNQSYAEGFNRRHARVGHLFQGRFKGILVEREGHLLELLRYIVLNPVRCHAVEFAGDYRWSNYRATAGLRPRPPWLNIDWTLAQFGAADRMSSHEAYRRFVAGARGASYNPWEGLIGQIYLGSAAFCDRMQALVKTKKRSCEHPRRQCELARPSFDTIVALVAEMFALSPGELRRKSRGPGRKALAQVAVDDGGSTLGWVAEWMGVTASAVSKMRRAAEDLNETDEGYRARLDRIRASLS